jgi:hypothetical protein
MLPEAARSVKQTQGLHSERPGIDITPAYALPAKAIGGRFGVAAVFSPLNESLITTALAAQ